ncbi:MAG: pectin acetylesterase-family hydrolase [Myxococcota bacterium]
MHGRWSLPGCVVAAATVAACKADPSPPTPMAGSAGAPPPSVPSASAPPVRPTRLRRVTLQATADENAVCHDGSPPALYLRRGTPAREDHWIVVLGGGATCTDARACPAAAPRPRRSSPPPVASRHPAVGILDGDEAKNPDFAGVSQVLVPSCSLDAWMGDRGASEATGGQHHRGHRIVAAVLEALRRPRADGPSLRDAKRLVLAGVAEGALGVIHHLDRVAAQLPQVEVRGLVDGLPRLRPLSLAERRRRVAAWAPVLDASCTAAAAASGPAACVDALDVLRDHVATPLFLRVDLRRPQVGPATDEDAASVASVRASEALARALLGPRPAGFGSAYGAPAVLLQSAFFEDRVQNDRLSSAVARFVFARAGAAKVVAPRG